MQPVWENYLLSIHQGEKNGQGNLYFSALVNRSIIEICGKDRLSFLNNLVTSDLMSLNIGDSIRAAYLTPKGRVIALFTIKMSDTSIYCSVDSSLKDNLIQAFSRCIFRAKVSIHSSNLVALSIFGESFSSNYNQGITEILTQCHCIAFPMFAHSCEVWGQAETMIRLCDQLKIDAQWAPLAHWERLEIRAGIPNINEENSEKFIPQSINLDLIGSISFNKGCYPGQEIVARTRYLGKLKRRMVYAQVPSKKDLATGCTVFSATEPDKSVGVIVRACRIDVNRVDCLISIHVTAKDELLTTNINLDDEFRISEQPYIVSMS